MSAFPTSIRQAAVIPVRDGRVCLVRSRRGKRWVVPKGRIEPGQTPAETALQEAWEEAGLTGILQAGPVGSYLYRKCGCSYHVLVFLMHVTDATEAFPESRWREQRWFHRARVHSQVQETGLRELIRTALRQRVEVRGTRGSRGRRISATAVA
jgi:8-oxo-dGTP pyrophosphatase MutT (NUDIX family)